MKALTVMSTALNSLGFVFVVEPVVSGFCALMVVASVTTFFCILEMK
ncbi:hypothetical protein LAh9_18 [Aeromonas phage LAh_9]|uniref:Uncharacterized protein n=3 Tax=Lahexavirus TaxID=2843411 RepID=A0A514A147_9CAUD|nr:hypothetical protein HWC29_gp091 [Aeromonas phage 4_4572]YP_009847326.1 hypothetical protein HWC30_gp152 [Aeromonas phage LAh_6]YP_009847499.1 hypothetical protein HWC32_gp018 [Aeromonas phage LAh_9]QDH46629.1 hypothetical protein LAh6_152 [Aeromonas phage LAh_6]QDH46999.1 hypothetical protein LAh9_18 [Aeromonas phage LAh_9]QEG09095.1 hypothetical protein [Aeromonas phage 4_4572]